MTQDKTNPGRILLVDDHAAFRSEFMECFSEYDIIEACSGEESLEILKKPNKIDLIFLDVNMPGMNGIQVLEKIRSTNSDVGIIIQTGYGSKEVFLNTLREKVDDYIEKPINIKTTKEIIERILSRSSRNKRRMMPISDKRDKGIESIKEALI